MITTWECTNSKCKKQNHYSKRQGEPELFLEMKVIGPKKIVVTCKYCKAKQTIEVYE